MIELTLSEIATAVSGTLAPAGGADAATTVRGLSYTDSREVVAGGIFFAKRGETSDGHEFAPQAVANGAALLIVERELDAAALGASVPQIVVADTVVALGALATEVVARVHARGGLTVIGITGSNGKTTTKNLLAAILSTVGETVAPKESFNNEVGAPITMLQVTDATRFLVSEMGAAHVGDIARLVRMARPDIGVVLKVGLAHAGEYGGIEYTQKAKTEMVTDLPADGLAVLNADDSRVAAMAEKTTAGEVLWFGLGERAQVTARDITATAQGTAFTLMLPGGAAAPVAFRVLGEHHVMNALAAASVAHAVGVDLAAIVAGLESVTRAERWRMEVLGGKDDVTVINDAYNASPDSMAAALQTLAQIKRPGQRVIAVLGEMAELGELAGPEHDRVGLQVVRLGIDLLVVVGAGARRMHISALREGQFPGDSLYFDDSDAAFAYLSGAVRSGDTILVKSSKVSGLRFLGDRLGESFS